MINIRMPEFFTILFCIFCWGIAVGGSIIKLMYGIPF